MKTKRRIYVADATLTAGQELVLSDVHAHYLATVLRLQSGDEVHLFNEQIGEWKTEIIENKKSKVCVQIVSQSRPPLPPPLSHLTLAFSPLKKDRTDFLVEKASELGVHALQPIFTDHTQSERVNIERLQTTAIEAAEQCDRLDIPKVSPAQKLTHYLSTLPKDAVIFLAAERGDATPIAQAFSPLSSLPPHIHFIIGPEGGFSEKEFEAFARLPQLRPIRLGPRLLRAETAAAAVLSAFQAIAGDWR